MNTEVQGAPKSCKAPPRAPWQTPKMRALDTGETQMPVGKGGIPADGVGATS